MDRKYYPRFQFWLRVSLTLALVPLCGCRTGFLGAAPTDGIHDTGGGSGVGTGTFSSRTAVSGITPSLVYATGLREVHIQGSGFVAGSIVTIGGDACENVMVTEGEIVCQAPLRASGTADIIVTNPNGESVTVSQGLRYLTGFNQASHSFNEAIRKISPAKDPTRLGKYYVGGLFTSFENTPIWRIARIKPDGMLDGTFFSGGFGGVSGTVKTILPRPDGDLLVGGLFTVHYYGGTSTLVGSLVRLFPDGSRITGFDIGAGFDAEVRAILELPGGGFLIGGAFNNFDGTPVGNVVRLADDGTLIGSTDIPGNCPVNALAFSLNGESFYAAGCSITRLKFNLAPTDIAFAPALMPVPASSTTVLPAINSLLVGTSAGHDVVYAGGLFTVNFQAPSMTASVQLTNVARFKDTGAIDSDFNAVPGANAVVNELAAVPNTSSVYVVGDFTNLRNVSVGRIARLLANGTVDSTFDAGIGFAEQVFAVHAAPAGVFLGGDFSAYNGAGVNSFVRLNADGSLGNDVALGSGLRRNVRTLLPLGDGSGRFYVGGEFKVCDGKKALGIVRLQADGVIDTAFSLSDGFTNGAGTPSVSAMTFAPGSDRAQAEIYVVGAFRKYGPANSAGVARLFPDGRFDERFNVGSGIASGRAYAVAVDGSSVYVGGDFNAYNGYTSSAVNGVPAGGLIRLDTDGVQDRTFGGGFIRPSGTTTAPGGVRAIAIVPDSLATNRKLIYVGGTFTKHNGVERNRLTRLVLPEGFVDSRFQIGTGFDGDVNAVLPLSDGRVYVGGIFKHVNGISSPCLARLNFDGTVDTSFNISTGFFISATTNAYLLSIAPGPDNTIYVGGYFTKYRAVTANHVARIKANGDIDLTFVTGVGLNNVAFSVMPFPDLSNHIVVGGNFTAYNYKTTNSVIVLNPKGLVQ